MVRRLVQVWQGLVFFSTLAIAVVLAARRLQRVQISENTSTRRCFPGDYCWPTKQQWDAFNQTLRGKLIATTLIASACHLGPYAPYDAQKCADLQSVWNLPEKHLKTSSSVMARFFAN